MIVAKFIFGPFDGKRLVLPCDPEDPWPKFVVPNWENPLLVEVFYLRSGQLDEQLWAYLHDDSYSLATGMEPITD